MGLEVSGGRATACDITRRRDVIGRDRVAEQGQCARTLNRLHWVRLHLHSVEVRWVAHVSRLRIPGIELAGGHFDRAPVSIASEYIAIATAEHLRVDRSANGFSDFLCGGPNIFEEDGLAIASCAERFVVEINIGRACECISNDQRRRGEEVHFDFRMHAAFEVTVTREHGRRDHISRFDSGGNLGLEWSRVADAGHATITGHVEADLGVVVEQLGLGQVVGDHLRARRETRLDPWLGLQALGGGIAREQGRAEHHRGVRRVGAARDGGNQYGAIFDLEAVFTGHLADTLRGRVFLGALFSHLCVGLTIDLLERAQRHAILRALGTGE